MSRTQPLSLLTEGIAAVREGNKDEARRLLQEATQLDPDNEFAWLWLASVAETPQEVVRCLEETLDINPDNPQARAGIKNARLHAGIAAAKEKDKAAARGFLAKVAADDPRNETVWMWLASVSETPQDAIAQLERVLDINPGNEKARSGLQAYQAQIKEPEPAWSCPLCGAAEDPEDDRCASCRAVLSLGSVEAFFVEEGADPEAMREAAERLGSAVKQKPTFEGHFHAALAFLNGRRIAEAIPHLRSAVQMRAGDRGFRDQVRAILQKHAAEEAAAKEREAKQKARQATILCIDDSATVRTLVTKALRDAGHRVLEAKDCYEAIDLLRDRGIPDLIILDVDMPGMDGHQMCKFLRQNEATSRLPIVMLTGKDGFFNKLRGQMSGSTEYLTKPVQPSQVVSVVAKYCGAELAATPA